MTGTLLALLIGLAFAVLTPLPAVAWTGQTEGPESPPVDLLAEGGRALESGDLEAAAERFAAAAAAAPGTPLPWLGLSEVAERQGDALEALRLARRAESLAPNEPRAVFAVSRQLSRLMRFEEALQSRERLRALDPTRPEGYLLAAAVLRRTGGDAEAVRILESGVEAGGDDSRLTEELTLVLLSAGEIERARQVAAAAIERFPDQGGLRSALGLALAADPQRRSEAVAPLREALDLGVASPEKVHLELATLLMEQGDSEQAIEHLRAAAALQPDASEVHYRLGNALRNTGDMDGARTALGRYQELRRAEQQVERDDRNVGTRFNEAQSLANDNRLPEALAAADALLAEHPRDDRALALRGKVLFSLGRREEALEAVAAARAAAPNQVEYHYLEGLFLMQLGRPAEAELPLERAAALEPGLAEVQALLGMMLSSLERYEEAVVRFERALELGAEGTTLRLGFAEALRGAGRLEDSERQMEAYRRLADG